MLYEKHWFPMEQDFGKDDYASRFDQFMRDYLTFKTGRIPNIREVYGAFKNFARAGTTGAIGEVVADIHRHSKHFTRIALGKEDDPELRRRLDDLNTLRVDVAYPFLLEVFEDKARGLVGEGEVGAILGLLESYVFRRAICGIPTNALNKTFASLGKELVKTNYLESFGASLILKDGSQRFPSDEEFRAEFVVKDIYNFRNRNYLLRKLENFGRKERVIVEGWTIEHILPQSENLSAEWRASLGENWQSVRARHLHTIGNLTLTGYNPELSDRTFCEKRDMRGGFAESPFRLNQDLAKIDRWGEDEIRFRAERLAQIACEVWSFPKIRDDILARYRKPERNAKVRSYSLDDHPQLAGRLRSLFDALREKILGLNAGITEKILKGYIAYKLATNFVDVHPQKTCLCLFINMDYPEINDPKGMTVDMTGRGHWGNGDVLVRMNLPDQMDDVMALVKQSFEKQAGIAR